MAKRAKNPAELVLMGANPSELVLMGANPRGQRARQARSRERSRRTRNSSGLQGASEVCEEFRGEPCPHVDTYVEPEPRPANLGQLGVLRKLQVKRTGGWKWGDLDFLDKGVQVAGNVGKSQIYFVGGDQKITRGQLTQLGVDNSKELVDLGECMEIEYRAKKEHVNGIASNYYHQFGDATGRRPRLMYDCRVKRLSLVGGEYEIRPEGIYN